MFEKLNCSAIAEFDLCPLGPVLVSGGHSHKTDPTVPDITFMTGFSKNGGITEECYVIPGSTVKGVLRHYIQDNYIESQADVDILFGKITGGAQRSKINFHDAYAVPETVRSSLRNSTRLDPNNQAPVHHSLNNMEVIEKGVFKAGFQISNFTQREMEAILLTLLDINTGAVRFGGKVSRGFGQMYVDNFSMTANKGYSSELAPVGQVTFTDIEQAVKYFREVW